MGVLPSLRATLRSDKQPPMSELSPNAKSALKAACPLLAGADIGRTRWPSSLLSVRKWMSGSAKPSTELFRGRIFGGGGVWVTRFQKAVAQRPPARGRG